MTLLVDTLAPLVLIIILGDALARIRFLGPVFIADLNKLAFWIALPALLFTSANRAAAPDSQVWRLLAVLPRRDGPHCAGGPRSRNRVANAGKGGTLMQSAFRGNLAYIGIPLLAYSFSESAPENGESPIASDVIVMILTMAVYNILAVVVLQARSHSTKRADWKKLALSIATNPLLVRDCSV